MPRLVAIGLISYSLYLWHWPVLVFGQYVNGGHLDTPQTALALGIVVGASLLTYRFVERPVRDGNIVTLAQLKSSAERQRRLSCCSPERPTPPTVSPPG